MTAARDRTSYLGSHDIGAVVGVHPWLSAVEVRAIKRGEVPPVEQTERMAIGLLLEDGICEGAAQRLPEHRVRRAGFLAHRVFDYLGGHTDRVLFHPTDGKGILDAKATGHGAGWGDPGSADVPPYVTVQQTWNMGLARADYAYVARLLGTSGLDLYRLTFDPQLYAALEQAGIEFWRRHVVGGEYVEPDGSEAYRAELRRRFPVDNGLELVATPEVQLLVEDYGAARADEKTATDRKARIQQRIELAMGEATSLVGAGFTVTWRLGKGRTDWKAVADALTPSPDLIEEHTGEGTRVFRVAFAKGEEEAA